MLDFRVPVRVLLRNLSLLHVFDPMQPFLIFCLGISGNF